MIASLGLAIAIRYSVQAIFGPRFLRYDFAIAPGMKLAGAFVTRQQLWILAIVSGAVLAFHLLLQYTTLGKAMRATATNRELAQASGVDTERVIAWVWFIGTGFAALGGALIAWDTQLVPELGFNLVIPAFCVVLIGGVGSVYGAILGALAGRLCRQFRGRDRHRTARQLARRRRREQSPHSRRLQAGHRLCRGDPGPAFAPQRAAPARDRLTEAGMEQLASFAIYMLTITSITFILAISLDLQVGHCGIVNFGQVMFLAVGAYATAIAIAGGVGVVAGANRSPSSRAHCSAW